MIAIHHPDIIPVCSNTTCLDTKRTSCSDACSPLAAKFQDHVPLAVITMLYAPRYNLHRRRANDFCLIGSIDNRRHDVIIGYEHTCTRAKGRDCIDLIIFVYGGGQQDSTSIILSASKGQEQGRSIRKVGTMTV